MRKVFVLLSIIAPGLVSAQNYQNICSQGITFYKNGNNSIKAFRLDSLYPYTNGDTTFISYRTFRDLGTYCYDTTNGSALGRKIIKKSDGTFYFFNYHHDTITINTQSEFNDQWKLCNISTDAYIEATLGSVVQDTIFGIADSVKIISLQAKNLLGDTIACIYNHKTINLSQNFGLTKIYDVYFIPDIPYFIDTSAYVLAGKSGVLNGLQAIDWKNIYDFEVGDEFHYWGDYNIGPDWKYIKRVLAKYIYGNIDSVSYVMEYCRRKHLPQPPPNIVTSHDTITETYNFITLSNDYSIKRLPEEFVHDGYLMPSVYERYLDFNNRQTQAITYDVMSFDSCWFYYTFEYIPVVKHYAEGLGQTAYYYNDPYSYYNPVQEYLQYYKKGLETWGTPVAADCEALFESINQKENEKCRLLVCPNPVADQALLTVKGLKINQDMYLFIYNCTGQDVLSIIFNSNTYILCRNGLPGGLYLLIVMDKYGNITGKHKLIFQ
jgi:hypothetical protein